MQQKYFITVLSIFLSATLFAQLSTKLNDAWQRFTGDSQMKYGIASIVVVDVSTGATVFSRNENVGLAPASTLKVVTAATALDMFGPSYRFTTTIGHKGAIQNGVLKGNIVIQASGDPTLGSWRYAATKKFAQLGELNGMLEKAGIQKIEGQWVVDESAYSSQATPGGWPFDDMGNYYGAGAAGFNWYENQYDLILNPGNAAGQPVKIASTGPVPNAIELRNELLTGPSGSGDRAIIYPDLWPNGTVRGTVPAGAKEFTISGSIAEPAQYFFQTARNASLFGYKPDLFAGIQGQRSFSAESAGLKPIGQWTSPGLDSIVYFFLQKSVNIYGEALAKQIGKGGKEPANTEQGVKMIREHWNNRGIDAAALHMYDGSGLSPSNRVTARALVQVMQYARTRDWFGAFYEGLPTINGLKMKSGSITGVRAYTGYATTGGKTYAFAFLVNNFDGSSSAVMQKMFTLLNVLK
jgi:D-alanyl-D-alanine carboxypeptidase/D-alanyl-D-alanine-endopeptidase (penicillin-binding protein 4)